MSTVGNILSDSETEDRDASLLWDNDDLDPDDKDQLLDFFNELGALVLEKRRFLVNGKEKTRCYGSHLRLFAALVVHY